MLSRFAPGLSFKTAAIALFTFAFVNPKRRRKRQQQRGDHQETVGILNAGYQLFRYAVQKLDPCPGETGEAHDHGQNCEDHCQFGA